jgi:hypothetical protein
MPRTFPTAHVMSMYEYEAVDIDFVSVLFSDARGSPFRGVRLDRSEGTSIASCVDGPLNGTKVRAGIGQQPVFQAVASNSIGDGPRYRSTLAKGATRRSSISCLREGTWKGRGRGAVCRAWSKRRTHRPDQTRPDQTRPDQTRGRASTARITAAAGIKLLFVSSVPWASQSVSVGIEPVD